MFLKFIFTDQKVGGILLCTSVAFSRVLQKIPHPVPSTVVGFQHHHLTGLTKLFQKGKNYAT